MPIDSLPESVFAPGQIWTYRTRPQEPDSRFLILRVDSDPAFVSIIHIRVTNLRIKNPQAPTGFSTEIGHMPYSEHSLADNVNALKLERANEPVPADYEEGYDLWKAAFDNHEAGVFTAPLSEVIDGMESALEEQG